MERYYQCNTKKKISLSLHPPSFTFVLIGEKEKVIDCKRRGVIRKRLDVSKIDGAQVEWLCLHGEELCYDSTGLEIQFEQKPNGHLIIDTPKLICGTV